MPKGIYSGPRGRGYRARLTRGEQDALDAAARSIGIEEAIVDGIKLRPGVVLIRRVLHAPDGTLPIPLPLDTLAQAQRLLLRYPEARDVPALLALAVARSDEQNTGE